MATEKDTTEEEVGAHGDGGGGGYDRDNIYDRDERDNKDNIDNKYD